MIFLTGNICFALIDWILNKYLVVKVPNGHFDYKLPILDICHLILLY